LAKGAEVDVNLFTHHRNDLVTFFRSTECKETLELKRIEIFTSINKARPELYLYSLRVTLGWGPKPLKVHET